MKYYYVTNTFDWHIVDKETAARFKLFWNLHGNALFLLNERNILISLLMIHLKCTVVDYANLNSSSMKQTIFKLWAIEYVISFWFFFNFLRLF